ncbi:MAG: peptidyl-tRNA hydrolase Pth2 [Candidatus Micrarchaeota archaeon]
MYKQAIVIRTDLEMSKGKMAGQTAHASVSAYVKVEHKEPEIARAWLNQGQKKIVLKVGSESELFEYFELCKRAGLIGDVIHDAGKTQLTPNTPTAFGIGPAKEEEIDKILGKLKLL